MNEQSAEGKDFLLYALAGFNMPDDETIGSQMTPRERAVQAIGSLRENRTAANGLCDGLAR